MSADPPDASSPTPGSETPAAPLSGVDLARAALAEARAAARERAGKPGTKPVRRARQVRTGDGRDPQMFGDAIQGLISERGWEVPAAGGTAMDRWAEIVGSDIAAHTEPVSFTEGVLVVQASSTAWSVELKLLAPRILHRLNTELGHGTVVRIDVKGPAGPSWKKGRLRVQDGRGPRDTYG